MDIVAETPVFVVTAVVLVAYELVKGLIAKGLNSKETVEEALWKKGVTDSLSTLIQLTDDLAKRLESPASASHTQRRP